MVKQGTFFCYQVIYCEKACQKMHWFTHKKVCNKLQEQREKQEAESAKLRMQQSKGTWTPFRSIMANKTQSQTCQPVGVLSSKCASTICHLKVYKSINTDDALCVPGFAVSKCLPMRLLPKSKRIRRVCPIVAFGEF